MTNQDLSSLSVDYKKVAKKLNVRHLFGRWGISFRSHVPEGKSSRRVKLVPLDGWLFGNDMYKELEKRDFEL